MKVNYFEFRINLVRKRILDWTRMKKIIAIVLKYGQILNQSLSLPSDILTNTHSGVVNIDLLGKASIRIIKMLQQRAFLEELIIMKKANKQNPSNSYQSTSTKASAIYGLDLFLDDNGVLKVGDQLRNSSLYWNLMLPILMPRNSVMTNKIIEWCHNRSSHSGRNMTLNKIRCNSFWIISGNVC